MKKTNVTVSDEAFDVVLDDSTENELTKKKEKVESVEISFNKLFSKEFTKLPMIIRVKYILDTACSFNDEKLSYSRINSLIRSNIQEGDYNILPETITCISDITELYYKICQAASGLVAWCKRTCKDCGREFYLYLSEVDFYKGKGFALPKRCKDCIKNKSNSYKEHDDNE